MPQSIGSSPLESPPFKDLLDRPEAYLFSRRPDLTDAVPLDTLPVPLAVVAITELHDDQIAIPRHSVTDTVNQTGTAGNLVAAFDVLKATHDPKSLGVAVVQFCNEARAQVRPQLKAEQLHINCGLLDLDLASETGDNSAGFFFPRKLPDMIRKFAIRVVQDRSYVTSKHWRPGLADMYAWLGANTTLWTPKLNQALGTIMVGVMPERNTLITDLGLNTTPAAVEADQVPQSLAA